MSGFQMTVISAQSAPLLVNRAEVGDLISNFRVLGGRLRATTDARVFLDGQRSAHRARIMAADTTLGRVGKAVEWLEGVRHADFKDTSIFLRATDQRFRRGRKMAKRWSAEYEDVCGDARELRLFWG